MKLKNLTHEEFLIQLKSMGACSRGIEYIKKNKYDLKTFWENSDNADYLYWYANRMGVCVKQIVLLDIKIARLTKLSDQSENVFVLCEKWANGDDSITHEELKNALWDVQVAADAAFASSDKKQEIFEIIRGLIEIDET